MQVLHWGTKAVGWIKRYLKAAGDLESKHNTCPGVPFLKVKLQACLKNWNCLCRLHPFLLALVFLNVSVFPDSNFNDISMRPVGVPLCLLPTHPPTLLSLPVPCTPWTVRSWTRTPAWSYLFRASVLSSIQVSSC